MDKGHVLFALNTGMRQNEIFTLKWSEVDLFRKTVTVIESENYDKRTIPLNEIACNLLSQKAKIRAMSGLVFPNLKTGQKIIPQNLMWHFYNAQKETGIDHVRFHDLRQTFSTRLVQSGIDLYKVSKLLGHRDIKTTQRYAHITLKVCGTESKVWMIFIQKIRVKILLLFTILSR
jgi:integrase